MRRPANPTHLHGLLSPLFTSAFMATPPPRPLYSIMMWLACHDTLYGFEVQLHMCLLALRILGDDDL